MLVSKKAKILPVCRVRMVLSGSKAATNHKWVGVAHLPSSEYQFYCLYCYKYCEIKKRYFWKGAKPTLGRKVYDWLDYALWRLGQSFKDIWELVFRV